MFSRESHFLLNISGAEFKDLEVAIVRLDSTLHKLDSQIAPIELDRETDKYIKSIESYKAGPRISRLMPSQLWNLLSSTNIDERVDKF
jgi:hypothetical protein